MIVSGKTSDDNLNRDISEAIDRQKPLLLRDANSSEGVMMLRNPEGHHFLASIRRDLAGIRQDRKDDLELIQYWNDVIRGLDQRGDSPQQQVNDQSRSSQQQLNDQSRYFQQQLNDQFRSLQQQLNDVTQSNARKDAMCERQSIAIQDLRDRYSSKFKEKKKMKYYPGETKENNIEPGNFAAHGGDLCQDVFLYQNRRPDPDTFKAMYHIELSFAAKIMYIPKVANILSDYHSVVFHQPYGTYTLVRDTQKRLLSALKAWDIPTDPNPPLDGRVDSEIQSLDSAIRSWKNANNIQWKY